ncbi:MAG: hypothetical protein LLF83_11535 [Methanobacterium sp.]|nr:hypothetical protein [Methanobacterium sp.]
MDIKKIFKDLLVFSKFRYNIRIVKNMEEKVLRYLNIVLGIFYLFIGLFEFVFSKLPLDLLVTSFGLVILIFGLVKKDDLFKKKFYLLFFGVIVFQGATIISTYLFIPQNILINQFIIALTCFILLIIVLIHIIFKNRKIQNNIN